MVYRVISADHGLEWTGEDKDRAEYVALCVAVITARTVYLNDGTESE